MVRIRDKKLLSIIRAMLKAPIQLPNGEIEIPTKGTPQGGILSPLLANVVLNELDQWISSQRENFPMHNPYKPYYRKNGSKDNSAQYTRLRKTSKLKNIFIVRYADDFKIFCRNINDANKTYHAVTKLKIGDMHCHHIKPRSKGGIDNYKNLILITEQVHKLIHATKEETIQRYLEVINPNAKQLQKINELREEAGLKRLA